MELFLEQISSQYKLDCEKLIEHWTSFNTEHTMLNKMKKPELLIMCKEKGFCCKGSKPDLIKNIINKLVQVDEPKKEVVPKKKVVENIISEISKHVPVIVIKRNKHGNHEHQDTHMVFDHKTRTVVGVQQDDGSISMLTKADIEKCHELNFKYNIPTSLNQVNTEQDIEKEITDTLEEDDLLNNESEDSEEEIEYSVDE